MSTDERRDAAAADPKRLDRRRPQDVNFGAATRDSSRTVSSRAATSEPRKYHPSCTGGRSGPKIAVRMQRSQVSTPGPRRRCSRQGLRRVHPLRLPALPREWTAGDRLQPWMRGDHVVLATPEGYRGKTSSRASGNCRALPRLDLLRRADALFSLLETPIGDNDLSSLKFAFCGAAPMPLALIRAFEANTGLKIIEGYGLTEGACVSSLNPPRRATPRLDRPAHPLPADGRRHPGRGRALRADGGNR